MISLQVGAWIALTALGAVLARGAPEPPAPAPALEVACSIVVAVPAGMMLLHGVVDGISPMDRLPRYTRSTSVWSICGAAALAGALPAFVV